MASDTRPESDPPPVPGLVFVSDDHPGIGRRKHGKGFTYTDPDGRTVRDRRVLARIRRLAIPPAWTDVWISPLENGHLQVTGRDAAGRKQYRYHEAHSEARQMAKFEHLIEFAEVLPLIRERTARDLRRKGLPREKILAAVVRLLETTLIRVGNETYARTNGSFGLTTLRNRHVAVEGSALRFRFTGKSGKSWKLKIADRRLARVVRSCQHLPGQRLFQYLDEEGRPEAIDSSDVNAYLRDVSGRDVTAKDFRTWAGTVLAALALHAVGPPEGKTAARRALREAVSAVAVKLGNTPAICRKSYIHPAVFEGFEAGSLRLVTVMETVAAEEDYHGLEPEELAVLSFLRGEVAAASRERSDDRDRARQVELV